MTKIFAEIHYYGNAQLAGWPWPFQEHQTDIKVKNGTFREALYGIFLWKICIFMIKKFIFSKNWSLLTTQRLQFSELIIKQQ